MKNLLQHQNIFITKRNAANCCIVALFLVLMLTISFGKGYAQCTPQGDPSTYGNHVWNVYVYNSGGAVDTGQSWNYSYSGYYVDSALNMSTLSRWNPDGTPSDASGYVGCPVNNDYHSWSAKRKGFACGAYQIDIPSHDDEAELYIDGVQVWEHVECCDSHSNVWTGLLSDSSTVVFRVTDGFGGSHGSIQFTPVPLISPSGYVTTCQQSTLQIAGANANSYLWNTGETSQTIAIATSAVGTTVYTLTAAINGCSLTSMDTIAVSTVHGNPSVYGNHVWNVYAFNAGDASSDNGHSWNDNYSGYYVDSALNFNSESKWAREGSPSDAAGYSGCPVNADNHSWSAKRKGFACGVYQIPLPINDDACQLFVNGVKVWENQSVNVYSYGTVWSGPLDDSSTVVFQVTEGMGNCYGSIQFIPINGITPLGPTTFCPGYAVEMDGGSADSYLWSTGETTENISVSNSGTYMVSATMHGCVRTDSIQINVAPMDTPVLSASSLNYCPNYYDYVTVANFHDSYNYSWNSPDMQYYGQGYSIAYGKGDYVLTTTDIYGCSASSHLTIGGPPGNASDFGNGVWKVNAYSQDNSWLSSKYAGYYVDSTLNFDSENKWNPDRNPSAAPGYQGCSTYDDFMSWSAKRQGFPCGIYRIDVLRHDDNAQLFVDGVKVWEDLYATVDSNINVWTGALNASSKVELRVSEIYGGSNGAINFTLVGGTTAFINTTGHEFVCTGQSYTLSSMEGASYLWSDGETTRSIQASQSGNFLVTVTDANGCALTSEPVSVTINSAAAPVAQITASATTICNWNPVTLSSSSSSGNEWSTNDSAQIITVSTGNVYSLKVTNSAGCFDTASIALESKLQSAVPDATNSSPACLGTSVSLVASGMAPGGKDAYFNGNETIKVFQDFPETDFTIEMWVKTSQADGGIFCASNSFSLTRDRALYLSAGQLYAGTYYYGQWNTGFTINDDKWHHIAYTVQTGVGQIVYVDGFSSGVGNSYDHSDFTSQTSFDIGGVSAYFYGAAYFKGQIDNVRIWSEARSQTDIRNNMMLETPTSSANLIYQCSLNGNANAEVGNTGLPSSLINYLTPNYYTYTWTGAGAPAPAASETQTTSAIPASAVYSVAASTGGCPPVAGTSTFVTITQGQNYYADADGDGYGSPSTVLASCTDPGAGYVTNNADCNDGDAAINPNAIEICNNGIDENCDGQNDVNCGAYLYYADNDADTYGNPTVSVTTTSSTPPSGYVSNRTDCNDANAAVHPGVADLCNGIDDNCDGIVDENAIATVTPDGNVFMCKGTALTLTANTGNGITYSWYRNGKVIIGASASAYTVSRSGNYYVKESVLNCSPTSPATNVSQSTLPLATISYTGSLNLCGNSSILLTANAGSGLTYQWKSGLTNISGATNQQYTATAKGTYKVVVTNSNGCSKTSPGVKVTKSCKTDLSEEQSLVAELNIYPNPAHGQFVIEINLGTEEDADADVQIFNSLGQMVYSQRAEVSGGVLHEEVNSVSNLSAGNYFVRVIVNEKVLTEKIVIQ